MCDIINMLYFKGEPYAEYYGLFTPQTIYNDKINPSTSMEFATSSFRILHNQIPAQLKYSIIQNINIKTNKQ